MGSSLDDIRAAHELLEKERTAVVSALAGAKAQARGIAAQQKEWRSSILELLARGEAVGLTVTQMARALGLSRQWTTHLRDEADRKRGFIRVEPDPERPADSAWQPSAGKRRAPIAP